MTSMQNRVRRARTSASMTQADLARLVGASRVRVNHVLTDLRRRGVLESGDHCLVLSNLAALESLR